jgi:DNA-binding MarR family transcriptional regulator
MSTPNGRDIPARESAMGAPGAGVPHHHAGAAPADDAGEVLELVHGLMHSLRREAADRSGPVGTMPGQVRLLRMLNRCDRPRRLGELAQAMDVAPRSMTSKVDQAEADGLVRRVPDPADRRATLVELTEQGRQVLADVWAQRDVGMRRRLERLTEPERGELLALLRRVAGSDEPSA